MIPNGQQTGWNPPGVNVPGGNQVPQPRRRWRFRWAWVSVPFACLLAIGILNSVRAPTFRWGDVMDGLHVSVQGQGRYTRLAVLGLTFIGVVGVLRILRKKGSQP